MKKMLLWFIYVGVVSSVLLLARQPVTADIISTDSNAFVGGIKHFNAEGKAPESTYQEKRVGRVVNRMREVSIINTMRVAVPIGNVVGLDSALEKLWPGALVQGKTLASGDLAEFVVARAPGLVTVHNLQKTGSGRRLFSRHVANPRVDTVKEAIHDLVSDRKTLATNTIARMNFREVMVKSYTQALLELGMSASWSGMAKFNAGLRSSVENGQNSYMVSIAQEYYSVSFTYPGSASGFFGRGVTTDTLSPWMNNETADRPHNPPLFVSQIVYGRLLLFGMTSSHSREELSAVFHAAYNSALSSGELNLDAQQLKVLQDSQITMLAIGGSSTEPAELIANPGPEGIRKYIQGGACYDPDKSPAAPIEYELSYLDDNTVAYVAHAADYPEYKTQLEPIPITGVRITFFTGDDNKDEEMRVFARLRQRNGWCLASGGNWGAGEWNENSPQGPFDLHIERPFTLDQCDDLELDAGQCSTNGSDPEWHMTFQLSLLVDGQERVVRNRSQDSNEFKLGDGKSDFTRQPISVSY